MADRSLRRSSGLEGGQVGVAEGQDPAGRGRPGPGPDAVTVSGLSPGGSFRDPHPMVDGSIFVSRATGAVDHLDPDADPD